MVSTQDLNRAAPSSLCSHGLGIPGCDPPRLPHVPLTRSAVKASEADTVEKEQPWEPQVSCSPCSPETVSASKCRLFFFTSPSSHLWAVCLCRFLTFQFGRSAALQSMALLGGKHVKSECRLCPHLLLQREPLVL